MPNHSSHPQSAHPYIHQDQNLEEDSELLLYRFHGWLCSLSYDVKLRKRNPAHRSTPRDIERVLAYLDAKDPVQARLLHSCLQMIGAVVGEAMELLTESIHWPTVEAFFCPPDADFPDDGFHDERFNDERFKDEHFEENFVDTPGQWLTQNHNGSSDTNAQTTIVETERAAMAKPTRRSNAASLRSLGRTLRTECDYEKRRFYAAAQRHELPTDQSAAPAIRQALSVLLNEPIASRKQLTARQWAQASSAIETQDLHWEAPKGRTPKGRATFKSDTTLKNEMPQP